MNEAYILYDQKSGQRRGSISITNDSVIYLKILDRQGAEYKLIADAKFEQLFGILKLKYSFECLRGNEISINGITPHLTTIESFLPNKDYLQKKETHTDEIYGTETFKYLDYFGNKFYYVSNAGKRLFDKIEINSNHIENAFLNIQIGDLKAEVLNKLKMKTSAFHDNGKEIFVTVCKSRFKGLFGSLLFKFDKVKTDDQNHVLIKIIYRPLDE